MLQGNALIRENLSSSSKLSTHLAHYLLQLWIFSKPECFFCPQRLQLLRNKEDGGQHGLSCSTKKADLSRNENVHTSLSHLETRNDLYGYWSGKTQNTLPVVHTALIITQTIKTEHGQDLQNVSLQKMYAASQCVAGSGRKLLIPMYKLSDEARNHVVFPTREGLGILGHSVSCSRSWDLIYASVYLALLCFPQNTWRCLNSEGCTRGF